MIVSSRRLRVERILSSERRDSVVSPVVTAQHTTERVHVSPRPPTTDTSLPRTVHDWRMVWA